MIKFRTLGEITRVVNNPVLTSVSAVDLYSFITVDGEVYLVANTLAGDDAYLDSKSIPAGQYLNGFLVRSLEGQELVADERHIAYGDGQSYANITAGTTLFTINGAGKLAIALSAPESGVYFKAVAKCRLNEKAVVLKVMVAAASGAASLSELSDVDLSTPATSGQVLKYNGNKWAAAADATE